MLGLVGVKFAEKLLNEVRSGYERTITAQNDTITLLSDEIAKERIAHGETRQLLQRAFRLEPRTEAVPSGERPHLEPLGRAKSWPQLRKKLEADYKKKPEDQAEEYWRAKIAAQEAESAKLDAQSKLEVSDASKISEAI